MNAQNFDSSNYRQVRLIDTCALISELPLAPETVVEITTGICVTNSASVDFAVDA